MIAGPLVDGPVLAVTAAGPVAVVVVLRRVAGAGLRSGRGPAGLLRRSAGTGLVRRARRP